MEKITELTPEQESRIPEWIEKWVKIGLSTEPADFDKAIAAAKKAYSLCGLDQPLIILKVGSPYAATIGGAIAYKILKDLTSAKAGAGGQVADVDPLYFDSKVQGRIWGQVNHIVSDNVNTKVSPQVMMHVRSQIGDGVWNTVNDNVRERVVDQISNIISHKISEHPYGQIHEQISGDVNNKIWKSAINNIWDMVYDLVGSQVSSQISNQVDTSVGSKVSGLVWDQINNQVLRQVKDHVSNQINNQISKNIGFTVGDNVWVPVREGVYDSVESVEGLIELPVDNEGISAMWCYYTAYFAFFRDVCGLKISKDSLERISVNEDLVTSCGWTWWHDNILVISDRPSKINRDAEGRLHCENGPSIEYRDGWSLYNWHGVSIPKEWITTKKPTAKEALTWENIEQRRAACEIIGWANVLKELDAKTIDEDGDPEIGTLVECSLPDSGKERFLRVLCGTSREFVIPVPREMKTAIEANSWTWGLSSEEYKPEVRT